MFIPSRTGTWVYDEIFLGRKEEGTIPSSRVRVKLTETTDVVDGTVSAGEHDTLMSTSFESLSTRARKVSGTNEIMGDNNLAMDDFMLNYKLLGNLIKLVIVCPGLATKDYGLLCLSR